MGAVVPGNAIHRAVCRLALALALAAGAVKGSSFACAADGAKPFLLHLNGISGKLFCDESLVAGLKAGGLDAEVRFYDWTAGDPGISALQAHQRNRQQAKIIAAIIERRFREHADAPIYITSHSGGTGLAAWALEELPDDVTVECVFMLAPALSPGYDLSKALRHVRGKLYAFTSPYDTAILAAGTKVFGTIDGQYCQAAGVDGFVRPDAADAEQYRKLVPQPYRKEWLQKYGHMGSHICPLGRVFAREYIAPLLLTGRPPAELPSPTTRPAATRPSTLDAVLR
jgi:hypothetical protein